MQKSLLLPFAASAVISLLTGCGTSNIHSIPANPPGDSVPVSISMTDDPPQGVQVLFFQVSLTSASLTPSSGSPVSLLSGSTPIQIDVTQLQALSAFLSTANVSPGSYTGLSLTFASPLLVIFNASDSSIASTCAVGSVCQLTPTIDDSSATVDLTSAPFPVTVAANSPLGFLVDFHLNTIIQSDLSVNLGVTNGITVGELPPMPTPTPRFGFLNGTVESVNASQNQFTLQTFWGRTFTLETSSSTTFNDFPSSACTTAGIACLAQNQVVQVQISGVESGGILAVSQVTYLQAANQQTVEGVIFNYSATGMKILLRGNPTFDPALPLGGVATVTFDTATTFSVDANGFTIPSGLAFAGVDNLWVGQTVKVNVDSGSVTGPGGGGGQGGWGPPPSISFTTNNVELEPGQITGIITALASPDFTLQYSVWPPCPPGAPCPTYVGLISTDIQTTSQTTYTGFETDSFSGLAVNNLVSVNGWLFANNGALDPAVSPPVVLAQTVSDHPNAVF
jgi:Domain of unknown function (DUF4382)